jgi:hypothetical protein
MSGWRKRQVLELALKALETAEIDGNCEYGATEIIRKALAQPERTWVGLTEGEVFLVLEKLQTIYNRPLTEDSRIIFAQAIEAKLKEKNT